METIGKGQLTLDVNAAQTEAALVFQTRETGEAWTREKVLALLKKAGVLEYVNPVALEKALHALGQAGAEKVRSIVAQGLEPKSDPDAIAWEANPIPPDLAAKAAEALGQAPIPRVYAWRTRKKRVIEPAGKKKAAAAPVFRTETVKEEKAVNQAIARTGYVAEGALVASIGTAKEGTPGRTFRGEPLPSPPPGKPEFYYGEGFTLRENKLYAGAGGFLRIGSNWVDLIPFTAGGFVLHPVEDGSDCLLSYTPRADDRPDELARRILAEAPPLVAGLTRPELLPAETIAGLLAVALEKQAPLTNQSLCRSVDSACVIKVSDDKIEATLSLRKHRGRGRPLTLADVSTRIRSLGIVRMDVNQVRDDVKAFFHDPVQRELRSYSLAQGSPPLAGENGSLEWEARFISPGERKTILARFEKQPNAEKHFPSLKSFPVASVTEVAAVTAEGKIARLTQPQPGQPGRDVFDHPLPGAPGKAIQINAYEHVKKYGLFLVSEIQGYLEFARSGDAYSLRVRPHLDAAASLEISADLMQAFLSARPHRGFGEPLSAPKVYALLAAEKVSAGIDEKAITLAVAAVQDGREVNRQLIAQGKPPVHAEGARLVVKVTEPEGKHVRILADGRADYKSVSAIPIVHTGDLVGEIVPPRTHVENGYDVHGKPIFARTKTDAGLPQFVNLKQVPGALGVMSLYAEKEGEFVVTPTAAGVRQVHVIAGDVGLETGNIDFPGAVHVRGCVREGFRVFAKGALTVDDLVEESVLSADGDIIVQQGVKGRRNAVIRTKTNIACLFAENAMLMAVGDIRLERSALNCAIKCNGTLTVGKTRGSLMGGTARARRGMTLVNLGAVSEVRTIVSFGQDYILADHIENGEKEVERLKARVLEIDRLMPKLPGARPEDAARLAALRDEKVKLLKAIDQHGLRLIGLRERFDEHHPGAVVVRGTVYPGVIIESHGRHFTVREEASGVQYTFDPKTAAIEEKPIVFSARHARRGAAKQAEGINGSTRNPKEEKKTTDKHEGREEKFIRKPGTQE